MNSPIVFQRRVITIGTTALDAVECPVCPGAAAIFPPSDMARHIARHQAAAAIQKLVFNSPPQPRSRYRRGRTPGAIGRRSKMSSTGIQFKANIRLK